MIEAYSILVALALAVLLLLLAPLYLRVITTVLARFDLWDGFCRNICRYKVWIAWLIGIVLGLFLCICWVYIRDLLDFDPWCLSVLFLLLLLAALLAFRYALVAVCCDTRRDDVIGGQAAWFWISLLAIFLAFLLLVLLLWLGGQPFSELLLNATCARLLYLLLLLLLLYLLLTALECRICKHKSDDNCQTVARWYLAVISFLLFLAIIIAWLCRDEIRDVEFELAMIGIYWDGKYEGEVGAHLRWNFSYNLDFPDNGFDLFRRPSSGGAWTLLNTTGRIHPVFAWTSGVVPGAWVPAGEDRIPPEVHDRYTGANVDQFDHLLDMLARDFDQELYYVEGQDAPFTSLADAETFAEAQSDTAAVWGPFEPRLLLQTLAVHPEVARLLGLYYIDDRQDADVPYDYKIVGSWSDRVRDYIVEDLSRPNTEPLDQPVLQPPELIPQPTRPVPGSDTYWPTEAVVGLTWDPPTVAPNISLQKVDGITSVLHRSERRDLGPVGGPRDESQPFEPLSAPDDEGEFVINDPVLVNPEETETGEVWPDTFTYDNWVDYRRYAYHVIGIDLFGRESEPSDPQELDVVDLVEPPPPIGVEAQVLQREDMSLERGLPPGLRDSLFPDGTDHLYVIRVAWTWPESLALRVPDVELFDIHYKITDYHTFSEPSNSDNWPDATLWEGPLGPSIDIASTSPLPPALQGAEDSSGVPLPDPDYYETFFEVPSGDPLEALLNAGDVEQVVYGFVSVASVDHSPFSNKGPLATPTVIFSRDLVAPPAPDAPALLSPGGQIVLDGVVDTSGGADRAGNIAYALRIPNANSIYTYRLERLDPARLAPPGGGDPAPALCPEPGGDSAALEAIALANPDAFLSVSAVAIHPSTDGAATVADYTDSADATMGKTYFYRARALDPAGNLSDPSVLGVPVIVTDAVPPRAPVVARILSADSANELVWSRNVEGDLQRYELYRTPFEDRVTSKRKMERIAELDPAGHSTASSASPQNASAFAAGTESRWLWRDEDVIAGTEYFYRLVAVDCSGNASNLSATVSARAIDLTPPPAPEWDPASPAVVLDPGGDPEVALTWQDIPEEPGVRFLLQRRVEGTILWRSLTGWEPGMTSFTDAAVFPKESYIYRLRAMDAVGNKGTVWSAELRVDIP